MQASNSYDVWQMGGEIIASTASMFGRRLEEENIANTLLICTTPELLEALEGLGSDYFDGESCFCQMAKGKLILIVCNHSSACDKARRALQKAMG